MSSRPRYRIRALLARLVADRRANFAVMTALSAPFAIALAAVAVDEGSLYNERRSTQALADIAAITAAANLSKADAAVLLTLKDNGLVSAAIDKSGRALPTPGQPLATVVPGHYDEAAELGSRFTAGSHPFNAVQVSLRKIGTLHFGSALIAPPVIGTRATARTSAQAAFSIGSGLVKADTTKSAILNAVLGGLLGTSLSLKGMDYEALARADIDVLTFTDALATRLHLTGVTYDEVLASKVTVGQIAAAMADMPGLESGAKLGLQTIAGKAAGSVKILPGDLVDLGSVGHLGVGQRPGKLLVEASALAMLTAAAALANGEHQVDVNLGATIPDLLSVKLSIAIGEREQQTPWLTVGEKGSLVRTAQTRLKLLVTLGPSPSTNPPLGVKLLSVQLPLHVEIAHSEAKLTDITCPTGRPESLKVSIAAQPGIASLHIADSDAAGFADFRQPESFRDATLAGVSLKLLLVNLDLLSIKGSASVAVANMAPTPLTFFASDIEAKAYKPVSTHTIAQSLTTSLIDNLSLSVDAMGLGIDVTSLLGPPKALLLPTLSGATAPVDKLLTTVLSALGVTVGNAYIRVTDATCGRSVLVQ